MPTLVKSKPILKPTVAHFDSSQESVGAHNPTTIGSSYSNNIVSYSHGNNDKNIQSDANDESSHVKKDDDYFSDAKENFCKEAAELLMSPIKARSSLKRSIHKTMEPCYKSEPSVPTQPIPKKLKVDNEECAAINQVVTKRKFDDFTKENTKTSKPSVKKIKMMSSKPALGDISNNSAARPKKTVKAKQPQSTVGGSANTTTQPQFAVDNSAKTTTQAQSTVDNSANTTTQPQRKADTSVKATTQPQPALPSAPPPVQHNKGQPQRRIPRCIAAFRARVRLVLPTIREVKAFCGFENESTICRTEAQLYVLNKGKRWRKRGDGSVLLDKEEDESRLVMLDETDFCKILNLKLFFGLKATVMEEQYVRFDAFDTVKDIYGKPEVKLVNYAIKLKDAHTAEKLCKDINSCIPKYLSAVPKSTIEEAINKDVAAIITQLMPKHHY